MVEVKQIEVPGTEPVRKSRSFPNGFRWGLATSAYQIEGAASEDGRGNSIWDTYSQSPGKIADGSSGDVAADHYHRFKDDIQLMAALGAKAYRFSISWPRIFPDGAGQINPKGLDFYNRLVDELLGAGIQPFATLYHWDLPQVLQDKGGWQSRDVANAFADYAACVAASLGDRVKHFCTLNECHTFVELGHSRVEYQIGGRTVQMEMAPGLALNPARLNQVRHHAVLAHGLAVRAIRASAQNGVKCGPAENINVAVPAIETPEHIKAAEIATRDMNAPYLTVMLEGKYPERYLKNAGADAPKFSSDDLQIISTPVDFVGLNVYRPAAYVAACDSPTGYEEIPFNASHPRMHSVWHILGPEALYWAPKLVHSLWNVNEIYITENGCATDDKVAANGHVYDADRVMFLRHNLAELQRATDEGVPVLGYFLWSLMDNFEWSVGFTNRFGIVYVDYESQRRIPKLSASFFRAVAARNEVL